MRQKRKVRIGSSRAAVMMMSLALLLIGRRAAAGPPFVTDDPEPVDLHHWEVYIGSIHTDSPDGSSGTMPHVEVNNGAAPNLQLHLILPLAFSHPAGETLHRGFGDTELGFKYRFVQETKNRPQIGIFPLAEAPSGNAGLGLGSGHLQIFLPVWAQKSWGAWTSYGGGGLWINPGVGNHNYGLFGWLLQKDLSKSLTLGNEFYYMTSPAEGVEGQFNFNFGGQYNFDEGHHFLFSVGRSIHGDTSLMSYLAYQWTFGREKKE